MANDSYTRLLASQRLARTLDELREVIIEHTTYRNAGEGQQKKRHPEFEHIPNVVIPSGPAVQGMPIVEGMPAVERMPHVEGIPALEGMPAAKGMPAVGGMPRVERMPAERMPAIEGTQIEPTIRQGTFETVIKDVPSTNGVLMKEGLFARARRWLLSFLR